MFPIIWFAWDNIIVIKTFFDVKQAVITSSQVGGLWCW